MELFEGGLRRGIVFARFYPQGAPLSGIYIGARGGIVELYRGTDASLAAGIEIGRTWLLGPKKNVAISTGLGLDRLFGSDGGFAIPNIRLVHLGVAF
jgi:hypothetical protein